MIDVPMTPEQRDHFAAAMQSIVRSRFDGSKRAAYTAAGVNSATWARVEAGESVKPHTLVKIVGALFPRTEGDWRKLFTDDGKSLLLTYWDVNGLHPDDAGDLERVLGLVDDPHAEQVTSITEAASELRRIRVKIAQLEYRLTRLEQHVEFDPFHDWEITKVEPGLSVVDDSVVDLVAADEQDQSISGEQESPDTP